MGITGLLPFLEKASKKSHLSEFRGYTVAIDSYCWLHRGAFACADKLARGENTDLHILYCLKYINLLLSYNIKPILVFDGKHLSAKELTEAKRREVRKNAKKRAIELLKLGKSDEARTFLRRCIDITHAMALCLIKECRKRGIDCIVAPYEADAQLAFLNTQNIAQIVITEDSDLTLFGCTKILFKLDLQGNGTLVDSSKLHLAMGMRPERYTFDKFRYMCILSGCDYLESLPGIGLVKACKFIKLTEDPDIFRAMLRIPSYLNMKNLVVPEEYRDGFMKADATFRHMLVYNPLKRQMIPLTDPDEAGTDIKYCCNAGEILDANTVFQLALGNLDPFTMKSLDNWNPDSSQMFQTGNSIWSKQFVPKALPNPVDAKKVSFTTTFGKSLSVDSFKLAKKLCANNYENDGNSFSIEDLTKIYGSNKSKTEKELHIEIEDSQSPTKYITADNNTPTTPNKSRNPFVKQTDDDPCEESPKKLYEHNPEITSPIFKMKLSKDTSLIKSITSPQKNGKRKRLSKFDITTMPSENVKSRFFNSGEKETNDDKAEKILSDDELFENDSKATNLANKYGRNEKIKKLEKSQSVSLPVFHPTFKNDKNCSRDIFKGLIKNNEFSLNMQKIDDIDFKNPVKDDVPKSVENADKDVIIVDDGDISSSGSSTMLSQPLSNLGLESTKHILKKSFSEKLISSKQEHKKLSCKRPGLSKTKSTSSTGQSRLSMFGFKKKEQLSLQ